MKEAITYIVLGVLIFSLSAYCGIARWNECRKYHPWWYCASNDQ